MSESDELVVERRGPVLVARLNRPDARNSLNASLFRSIGAAVLEAESDPDLRVLVLTGTGDRAFCAGMDLAAFAAGEQVGVGDDPETVACNRLMAGDVAVPLVGAANAAAVGGGLELLLGCDLIVASAEARFGLPEVKRGLFPGGRGTYLPLRVPLGLALELLLTGDLIDARRAYEIGLVNAVVAPGAVLDRAVDLAERIAANGPLGVAAVKEIARLVLVDADRAAER
ncbi:MAG: enoyl-CoA hydratase/isomerase family protein, partial [Acidimicrobiales bacterium]|nr:enoyl-CoA hydratase/isomerase family protein [Acidimicrobiales bacterium]